ncbi:hypothetical protein GCM10022419_091850 [Nonomuraea rosea]|uniref:HpcH/HpaI aldolase/citrate lyase domain-containing protein n=1 Tax=Nonomuraea rosea TaxID=638574 RepID=A0ABP6YYG3_9ACTN
MTWPRVRHAGASPELVPLLESAADLDGLRAFAEQNRALGYEGMIAIHPSHIPVINEVFSPSPEELGRYARMVAAMEAAQARGEGAITFEGAMAARARSALRAAGRTPP